MQYMQRALELASQSLGRVSPNPPVGAVVVRDGHIVGEGCTQPPKGSQAHAEVEALAQAGDAARGATLYVTLEPCCHQGRTPPCTQALLQAGIAEVHIAVLDPNPLVDGKGAAELEAAGRRVFRGEEAGAQEVMEGYLKWVTTGLPFVTAKYAMSLDGKIATATGESRWITGEAARLRGHRLRLECDAILVGVGTALQDDPQLTARNQEEAPLEHQPLRVVVDSQGRLPLGAAMLQPPGGRCIVATALPPPEHVQALRHAGAEVLIHPAGDGRVDLRALLRDLGERQVTSLLAEGGGSILASLVEERLVDKVMAFIAPVLIGGREAPTPLEGRGAQGLAEALRLERVTLEPLGEDTLLTGYPGAKPSA